MGSMKNVSHRIDLDLQSVTPIQSEAMLVKPTSNRNSLFLSSDVGPIPSPQCHDTHTASNYTYFYTLCEQTA
jgi:hypothetical protein